MSFASLRARLFAAIALVALLSLALALALGAFVTRRAVERNTLRDVSAQLDLLVERERQAIFPFARLRSLHEEFLDRQDERRRARAARRILPAAAARPGGAAPSRRPARRHDRDGRDALPLRRAARQTARATSCCGPRARRTPPWRPHIEGLVIAALATAALAALIAFLLARAIARPVRRVAEATRGLASSTTEPPLVPVEGARELALLAESFNEVAVALAKAREAERAFLLSVSHELKTPLTAIRGYAEGLGEGVLPAEEVAATIVRESQRLERLVGDLLDLARMNKAEFSVRREPIDLEAIAQEALRRYESQARELRRHARSRGGSAAPAIGDADRTLQIVSNLVENALRLTPAGGSVRIVTAPGSIRVEDTGPGLRPEELEQAFDRFYLYSRYGRERPVGTGLGLAIVKELAQGMGGSVSVESTPGRLTVFTVRLPHDAAAAPTRAAAASV